MSNGVMKENCIKAILEKAENAGGIVATWPEADGSSTVYVSKDGKVLGEEYAEGIESLECLSLPELANIVEDAMPWSEAQNVISDEAREFFKRPEAKEKTAAPVKKPARAC